MGKILFRLISILLLFLPTFGCFIESNDVSKSINTSNVICNSPSIQKDQSLSSITVNGIKREYRLSVPISEAGVKLPVLMAFHGGMSRDYPFPQQKEFDNLNDGNLIMVYPLSEILPPNEGEWQLNTNETYRQDIEFVEALIEEISSLYCVDINRFYATGYSLGSMFSYELACHMNDQFAAIASHAGTMPLEPNSCLMKNKIPIMHLHGTSDFIISYDRKWDWKLWYGSVGTMMDVPTLINFWSNKYDCQNITKKQIESVVHIVNDSCDGNVRVEHYKLKGSGHEWPNTINNISTPQIIWGFLSEFTKS